jgi:hypothetical protein
MFQEILQSVILSVVSRITGNISSLYIAIGATVIVVVCGFFLYKQFFAVSKSVDKPAVTKEVTFAEEAPQAVPENREEAFARAMQAEQEAMERELHKRQEASETTEDMEQPM